ncbi:MAG TPA: YjbH domain-containing protein [Thermohalobaculum sp.]|nr:YjbH domain-containing protein [Thermohalobaculum sp.]
MATESSPLARRGRLALLACTTALVAAHPAAAEEPVIEPRATHNLFGMTGLIDMPTAEMQPDGQVTATAGYHGEGYLRNTISAQIFPGIEGAFRYSVLDNLVGRLPDNTETLYDRSFDLKVRLLPEGNMQPAVVFGLQDFLGTGIYSGEYVALTKNFLESDLTVTGGFGWGRFGGRPGLSNPLGNISDRFDERDRDFGVGGEVEANQFFRGDVGLFGGVQYDTPIDGLTLKAEFSADDYTREEEFGGYDQDLPVNFGAEYEPLTGVHLGAYYLYGNEFGLRLSLSVNPYKPLYDDDLEPGPLPLTPRPLPADQGAPSLLGDIRTVVTGEPATLIFAEAGVQDVTVEEQGALRWATATLPPSADYVCPDQAAATIDAEYGLIDAVTFVHADGTVVCSVALRPAGERAITQAVQTNVDYPVGWYDDPETRAKLIEALEETLDPDRIGLFGIELQPRSVEVYVENGKWQEWPRAIGRTARALARVMPPSVELFKIVTVEQSQPVTAIFLERSALEATVNRPGGAEALWATARVEDAERPDWSEITGTLDQFPRYNWTLAPDVPVSLFDPDAPIRADLVAKLSGRAEFLPGLSVFGSVDKRLFGQLDQIKRDSNSVLPRVRSDFAEYLKEGDPGISRLDASYVTKLDEEIYGRITAGYLEGMHGGVSGEVLWKPVERSWGVGLEVNYTKQRDFDQLFGFQDYDVVTGHASLYWDTGFHGLSTQVDAGRYLAGDWGATFTAKRRFANGWELGGFFTLTDVPFDEFGEGSFDKGLFITVPFNWFLPIESRQEFTYTMRPLTRDGGARLKVRNRLYPIVEDLDRQALRRDWGSFWQ